MAEPKFTVVITTHNRKVIVGRAIDSVLRQEWPGVEVVVVDDASNDGTEALVRSRYPKVRYVRLLENQGPGPARNRGIAEAGSPWVVILDDDDQLELDALRNVAVSIAAMRNAAEFPVLQFACSNGSLAKSFMVVKLTDYLEGRIRGDFTPVIQRELFLASSLEYPCLRIGGENLLWWRIARDGGIPSWALRIVQVGTDAPTRLTSTTHQIRRAREFARLQEMTIALFGDVLAREHPRLERKTRMGAAAYYILARERVRGRAIVRDIIRHRPAPDAIALWGVSWFPARLTRFLFVTYRKMATMREAVRRVSPEAPPGGDAP